MRVTISRRDTADTAITAELFLLHTQSSSLTPGPGSEVGCNCSDPLPPVIVVIVGNCSDPLPPVIVVLVGNCSDTLPPVIVVLVGNCSDPLPPVIVVIVGNCSDTLPLLAGVGI